MPKHYESVNIGEIRHAPTPFVKRKAPADEPKPVIKEDLPSVPVQPKQKPSRKVKGNG
jgi:hypothetical protein